MAVVYKITPSLRVKLKEPFGLLLRGTFSETMCKLESIVKREQPRMIISVGDTVSRNLHAYGINPQLSITDNKSMRRRVQPAIFQTKRVVRVENPQGTITEGTIAAIRDALQGDEEVHLVVDGEEDLLTLIAVLYAPEKSWVVYGQPREGAVVVEVTPEKKAETAEILRGMDIRKAK